jgi:hypothetical protein
MALGSTQPPIQWVRGALSPGVKLPGREAHHSPPANSEIKKNVDLYIHSPLRLHGVMLNQLRTGTTLHFNNSIKFFIIYVPSQQPQGQLQAQHSVDTGNYIMGEHKLKSNLIKGEHWRTNT